MQDTEAMEIHEKKITQEILNDRNRGKRIWEHVKMLKGESINSRSNIKLYDEEGNL